MVTFGEGMSLELNLNYTLSYTHWSILLPIIVLAFKLRCRYAEVFKVTLYFLFYTDIVSI